MRSSTFSSYDHYAPAHSRTTYEDEAVVYAGHHSEANNGYHEEEITCTREIRSLTMPMHMTVEPMSLARCNAALNAMNASENPFAKLKIIKRISVRGFQLSPARQADCLPPKGTKGYEEALREFLSPSAYLELTKETHKFQKIERPKRFLEALRDRKAKDAAKIVVEMILIPDNAELERFYQARATAF